MSSSTGTVVFDDAKLQAVDVIATGKVGIGTSTPAYELDVAGGARADYFVGDGSNLTGVAATIDSTDDVPEGATNVYYTDARVDAHLNKDDAVNGQVLTWNGSDYAWVAQSGGGGSSSVWSTSGSDIYYNSGNVGIGTTNPQGGLHVYQKTLVLGELSSNPSTSLNGSMYYNTILKSPTINIDGAWYIFDVSVPILPTDINGLVGWYLPENWTGSQWTDLSGSANHTTSYSGTINYSQTHDGSSVGAQSIFPVLYGDTNTSIGFPTAILPSTYTLIHLTRWNGPNLQRIMDGQNTNWLSGHWGSKSGVAFHGKFLTSEVDRHGSKWVISTDQKNLYRSKAQGANWEQNTTTGGTTANLRLGRVGSESSEWMCAEIIVYNRELSPSEYGSLESYMQNKYKIY